MCFSVWWGLAHALTEVGECWREWPGQSRGRALQVPAQYFHFSSAFILSLKLFSIGRFSSYQVLLSLILGF